jgi:hypothetical protein
MNMCECNVTTWRTEVQSNYQLDITLQSHVILIIYATKSASRRLENVGFCLMGTLKSLVSIFESKVGWVVETQMLAACYPFQLC